LRLAHDCANIIGIKEASGNLEQVMAIVKDAPEDFRIISGDDALTLPIIASGGQGVISVVANAFPNEFSFMVHQAMDGNYGQARTFHYKLFELIQYLFVDGNPAGVKQALNYRGICGTAVRLPLIPVRKETAEKIGELILQNKLLNKLA
jgi:4-hydroxy-tetrahydrodipicolinate synthase